MTATGPFDIELSRTEWRLLRALATGAGNKQIARELDKSELTVRNQLSALFRKIKVVNRTQAVHWHHEYLHVTETQFISASTPLSAGHPYAESEVIDLA